MILETLATKIVELQIRHHSYFIIVFTLITLALIPGILLLVGNVEPSLEKVLPGDIAELDTMNDMRSQFGADMMFIVIEPTSPLFDTRNPQLIQYLDTLQERLKQREFIVHVESLASIVRENNGGIIPNSVQEIRSILLKTSQTAQYTNYDYSLAIMKITADTGANAKTITQVVNAIEEDIASIESLNPGVKTQITGYNAIDKATFNVIIDDFSYITLVSFSLVALIVFIAFKSFKKGALPLIVVMLALLWTMGIVGYLQLTLTVVSMVSAAMIMGLGIDFGIHVVHTFQEKVATHSVHIALKETMQELLRAMTGASLTTMAGFLALLFGTLPAMKILGIILAIGILCTLISAVLLLPTLIILTTNMEEIQ